MSIRSRHCIAKLVVASLLMAQGLSAPPRRLLDIDPRPLLREDASDAVRRVLAFLDQGGDAASAVRESSDRLGFDTLRSRLMSAVALHLIDQNRWDDALVWLDAWEQESPSLGVVVLTHRGMVFLESNRNGEAANLFERLKLELRDNPALVVTDNVNLRFLSHFGGSFEKPQPLKISPPRYSGAAIAAKVEGSVFFEGVIDIDGRLMDRQVVRGLHPDLDAKVLKIGEKWRFKPARLLDQPVRCYGLGETTFRIP